jgi:hypothetical protein
VPQSNQIHSYAARPASAQGGAIPTDGVLHGEAPEPTGEVDEDAEEMDEGSALPAAPAMAGVLPPPPPLPPVMAGGAAGGRRTDGGAYAACAAACVDAVAAAAAEAASAGAAARKRTPRGGGRGRVVTRTKAPTACMHLHAISHAVAQQTRRPLSAPAGKAASSRLASEIQSEIASLQARIRAREPDAEAAARLARTLTGDEFGARAASAYTALVKHSIAGVRRAEALEVQRGMAADRNARRDMKIEALRAQRMGVETSRQQAARDARRSSKEELGYRALYAHALTLEKERLLLAAATSEEVRRKLLHGRRTRQAALEHFETTQRELLADQLATEAAERSFRTRVQAAMGGRLEASARDQTKATLAHLHAQLELHERNDYGVPPQPWV